MSDDDLWFLPGPTEEDAPPLPRADRRALIAPADWLAAQAALAVKLARAAQALGALDQAVAGDPGMIRRLAMIEIEAMLWAEGTPLPREDIGRDLMAGRADYLLRVGVADVAAFDAFYKRLIAAAPMPTVSSRENGPSVCTCRPARRSKATSRPRPCRPAAIAT